MYHSDQVPETGQSKQVNHVFVNTEQNIYYKGEDSCDKSDCVNDKTDEG